jgi:beta-galactosidase
MVRRAGLALLLAGTVVLASGGGGWRPLAAGAQAAPAIRVEIPFDAGWRFSLIDTGGAAMPAYDDSSWRVVDLPHDWSAEGPFTAAHASGNGYAPGGIGWYRKHFTLDQDLAGKIAAVEFDGVYDHAEVWVNGHLACRRAYGYSSFDCPLTPYVRSGQTDNVVAVRVDHSREADSRWYTGSGIYRHVRLRVTDQVRIAQWGTFVTTPEVAARSATVNVETAVESAARRDRAVTLDSEIRLGDAVVARASTPLTVAAGGRATVAQTLAIPNPRRWAFDTPVLYTLRQRLASGSAAIDDTETAFGVREVAFDPARGCLLNGEPVKLKGVCVHHDAGSLGAAVPAAVWERRLRALKAIGVNAIRTSHNPPAPEFLDLCDRLGFLVMDEALDEFTPAKNKWVRGRNAGVPSRFGYAEDFAEWAVIDVADMVRRDRNHPSIVMWSIGNEVDYPNDPFTHPALDRSYRPQNPPAELMAGLARPLAGAIRALDPTRPVTMALASLAMSDAVGLPALLDVVGYNYQESRYEADHAHEPSRVILGSENGHQYGNWTIARDHPYVAGQFLWTGIDYLGEAGVFPNRANGAGLLDLAGFMKPMAWFRKSLWSDEPMVYLAAAPAPPASNAAGSGPSRRGGGRLEERWSWPEGSTVAVSAYTNAEEVALTLNGQVVGTLPATAAVDGVLHWDVPYRTGVLKAVARTRGREVAEFTLATAGPAARIELIPDNANVTAGAAGVWQVEVRVVDRAGLRVPDANTEITFETDGPVRVLGIGNGDLNDPAPGRAPAHRVFQGRALAVLQSTGEAGTLTLRASAPGLAPATATARAIVRTP